MSKHSAKRDVAVVGIDLGKTWLQVYGENESGQVCLDRKMKPASLKGYLSNIPPCLIAMEACETNLTLPHTLRDQSSKACLIRRTGLRLLTEIG